MLHAVLNSVLEEDKALKILTAHRSTFCYELMHCTHYKQLAVTIQTEIDFN
jgi:hypothetical protein